jgi:MarR family transcriptional regulator, lower aerobic nicotinate degradation pathway regulator
LRDRRYAACCRIGKENHAVSIETFYSRPGHLIRRLNQISGALFIEEAGSLGLTSVQFAALNMVREVPGIDQVGLSNAIAIDKTTIVGVVDRLVDKGLITRTRSPSDRRTNVLEVTARGLKVLKQIEPMLDRSDGRILAPLNKDEQRTFMQLITKLVRVNNVYSRAPLDLDAVDPATAARNREAAAQGLPRRGAARR